MVKQMPIFAYDWRGEIVGEIKRPHETETRKKTKRAEQKKKPTAVRTVARGCAVTKSHKPYPGSVRKWSKLYDEDDLLDGADAQRYLDIERRYDATMEEALETKPSQFFLVVARESEEVPLNRQFSTTAPWEQEILDGALGDFEFVQASWDRDDTDGSDEEWELVEQTSASAQAKEKKPTYSDVLRGTGG